jgi:CRISPR-associated protein Csx17
MPEVVLAGCTPEPLMGYLKALGVFRLVAEQADPAAQLSWAGDVFRLNTALDRGTLVTFFLNDYHPTPILAPWNSGSGFYGGGSEPLLTLARSTVQRLAPFRAAIEDIRRFLPAQTPEDRQKERLLSRCRAELSDEVIPWLDACFALGEDGPSYFPLLGTGGNDGRLDFTNNFFQRLRDVIDFGIPGVSPREESACWLASALFADDPELTGLGQAAVGQFNPGGIGGPNGVQGDFEAGSRVNPWDFILMIEGALLFAGSVARRLGANATPRAVFPFTVESVAVGYGSATSGEETSAGSRAELWLPVWDEPAGLPEVRQLFAEGRAQVGRRQARNAVEFAMAACLLGVSRGIRSFTRYGFLKRNGLAFLATPLGRVGVTPRPAARLLDDPPLTSWIDQLRRACSDKSRTPARYQTALRHIDRAMFGFAVRSQTDETADRRALLEVLRAIGQAERTLAGGLAFCKDKNIHPLNGLNPQWLIEAAPQGDDGREFRLAAALASVRGEKGTPVGPFRTHLEEVEQQGKWPSWKPGSTSAVWANRPPADNLASAFLRRWVESEQTGMSGLPLRWRVFAPLADVAAFLCGETDNDLLADLLWGLIGVNWSAGWFRQKANRQAWVSRFSVPGRPTLPQEFALLRLVVQPVGLVPKPSAAGGPEGEGEPQWHVVRPGEDRLRTEPCAAAFHRLRRGDLPGAVDLAARRLWADRITPFGWSNRHRRKDDYPTDAGTDPVRLLQLLAACLFPLSRAALTRLARQALGPPALAT